LPKTVIAANSSSKMWIFKNTFIPGLSVHLCHKVYVYINSAVFSTRLIDDPTSTVIYLGKWSDYEDLTQRVFSWNADEFIYNKSSIHPKIRDKWQLQIMPNNCIIVKT